MINTVKLMIQRVLRFYGWEIRRFRRTEMHQLAYLLDLHGVDLVIDVGANEGQFAIGLRAAGYRNRILSFEPLTVPHRRLCGLASADPLWDIAPRAAVGSVNGEAQINVSKNSVSSSILPIMQHHLSSAPMSKYVGTEAVELTRLDSVPALREMLQSGARAFLKADTQGYEMEVLKGAVPIFGNIAGIQLEISLADLYEQQARLEDLVGWLRNQGYECWALSPGFTDHRTGRVLQVDGLFFRADKVDGSARQSESRTAGG